MLAKLLNFFSAPSNAPAPVVPQACIQLDQLKAQCAQRAQHLALQGRMLIQMRQDCDHQIKFIEDQITIQVHLADMETTGELDWPRGLRDTVQALRERQQVIRQERQRIHSQRKAIGKQSDIYTKSVIDLQLCILRLKDLAPDQAEALGQYHLEAFGKRLPLLERESIPTPVSV